MLFILVPLWMTLVSISNAFPQNYQQPQQSYQQPQQSYQQPQQSYQQPQQNYQQPQQSYQQPQQSYQQPQQSYQQPQQSYQQPPQAYDHPPNQSNRQSSVMEYQPPWPSQTDDTDGPVRRDVGILVLGVPFISDPKATNSPVANDSDVPVGGQAGFDHNPRSQPSADLNGTVGHGRPERDLPSSASAGCMGKSQDSGWSQYGGAGPAKIATDVPQHGGDASVKLATDEPQHGSDEQAKMATERLGTLDVSATVTGTTASTVQLDARRRTGPQRVRRQDHGDSGFGPGGFQDFGNAQPGPKGFQMTQSTPSAGQTEYPPTGMTFRPTLATSTLFALQAESDEERALDREAKTTMMPNMVEPPAGFPETDDDPL